MVRNESIPGRWLVDTNVSIFCPHDRNWVTTPLDPPSKSAKRHFIRLSSNMNYTALAPAPFGIRGERHPSPRSPGSRPELWAVATFGGSPVPSIQVDDTTFRSSLPEDIQRHSRGSLGRGADMDSRVGWRGRMSPSSSRFRHPFEADDGAEPPAPDRPEAEGTSGASAKPQLSRSATVRATRSSGTSTASGLMIDVTDASGSR